MVFLDKDPEEGILKIVFNQFNLRERIMASMDLMEILSQVALTFVPLLFALCFHEYAHGLVAKWRGDNTAEQLGRLTLNPMAHADPIGTFVLPLSAIIFQVPLFFGWAKPVPVNPRNLKNVRLDMFWIALAGPASNILLACVTTVLISVLLKVPALNDFQDGYLSLFIRFIQINLFLAVFNLIPLHPLDGGKVLARFLPARINYKLEQNEQITSIILLVLVFAGALSVLRYPVQFMFEGLLRLGGIA